MATPTLAPSRPRARRILLRSLLALALLLLILVSAAAGWFYTSARAALPQLDGGLRLRGLAAPVTVTRDQQGVPHVAAATPADLFFAARRLRVRPRQ
jgi:penicillin amidase